MAKKGKQDLDNFDIDGFRDDEMYGEVPDFSDAGPGKNSRTPVGDFTAGALEAGKEYFMSADGIRTVVKGSLPKGYGMAIDAIDQTFKGVGDLYDSAQKDIKPVMDDAKKVMRAVIPKGFSSKLDKFLEESKKESFGKQDADELALSSGLAEVFKAQNADQQAREDVRHAITTKQNKISNDQLLGINNNVARLVAYQDQITIKFQQKTLEIQYRSFFVQRKLLEEMQVYNAKSIVFLDSIKHNTALPEQQKVNAHELMAGIAKERIINNIHDWYSGIGGKVVKVIKDDIRDFVGEIGTSFQMGVMMLDGMGMAQESGMSTSEMAGNLAGTTIAQKIGQMLAKPMRGFLMKNDKVNIGSQKLYRGFSNAPQLVNAWAKGEIDNPLPKWLPFRDDINTWLRNKVSPFQQDTTLGKSNMSNLDKMTYFNQLTQRSLTEVIPGWLSKIHKEIYVMRTGDESYEPEHFSFETGEFESVEKTATRIKGKLFNRSQLDYAKDKAKGLVNAFADVYEKKTKRKLSNANREELIAYALKVGVDETKVFDLKNLLEIENIGDFSNPRAAESLSQAVRDVYDFDEYSGERKDNLFTNNLETLMSDRFGEVRRAMPNPNSIIQEHFKGGDARVLRALKYSMFRNGTDTLDLQNYWNDFLDPKTYSQLELAQRNNRNISLGNAASNIRPAMPGMPSMILDQHGNPIGGGASQPQQSAHPMASSMLFDKVETMILELQNAVVEAIRDNTAKPEVNISNEKLEQLIIAVNMLWQAQGHFQGPVQPQNMHWFDRAQHGVAHNVMDALRGGKNTLGKMWNWGKSTGAPKAWGGAKSIFNFAKRNVTGLYNWATDQMHPDILWADTRQVAIKSVDLKAGRYTDGKTGNKIYGLDDITGHVMLGEDVYITEEDFLIRKFVTKEGKPLFVSLAETLSKAKDKLFGGAKSGKGWVSGNIKKLYNLYKFPDDVYVKGETEPRLKVILLRAGKYFTEEGEVVTSYDDLTGNIYIHDGEQKNQVLSVSEINDPGLVTRDGKPIRSVGKAVLGFGIDKAKWAFDKVKAGGEWALDKLKKGKDWAKEKILNGWNWLKGKAPSINIQMPEINWKVGMIGFSNRQAIMLERIYRLLAANMKIVPTEVDLPPLTNIAGTLSQATAGIGAALQSGRQNAIGKWSKFKNWLNGKAQDENAKGRLERLKDWWGSKTPEQHAAGAGKGLLSRLRGAPGKLSSWWKGRPQGNIDEHGNFVPPPGQEDFMGPQQPEYMTGIQGPVIPTGMRVKRGIKDMLTNAKQKIKDFRDRDNDGDVDGSASDQSANRQTLMEKARALKDKLVAWNEERKQTKLLSQIAANTSEAAEGGPLTWLQKIGGWISAIAPGLLMLLKGFGIAAVVGAAAWGLNKITNFVGNTFNKITDKRDDEGNPVEETDDGIGAGDIAGGAFAAGLLNKKFRAGAGYVAKKGFGLAKAAAIPTAIAYGASSIRQGIFGADVRDEDGGNGVMGTGLAWKDIGVGAMLGTDIGRRATFHIGTKLLPLLMNPVGLTLLAVGTAAYFGWKYYTRPKNYLARFRMMQYGFDPDDEARIDMISRAEEMIVPNVVFDDKAGAKIALGKVKVSDLIKIFKIDIENQEEVKSWVQWFAFRFRPILLTHLTVANKKFGIKQLKDIDDKLLSKDKLEYMRLVHFESRDSEDQPYKIEDSPFPTGMFVSQTVDYDADDVNSKYKSIVSSITSNAEEMDREVTENKDKTDEEKKKDILKKGEKGTAKRAMYDATHNAQGNRNIYGNVIKGVSKVMGDIANAPSTFGQAWDSATAHSLHKGAGWAKISPNLMGYIEKYARENGVDPGYMRTMAMIESAGDPKAESPTGARGIYQFTKGTGKQYGLFPDGVDNRFDEEQNVRAGAEFARDNAIGLRSALGREPEPWMLYLAHQQGLGGAKTLLKLAASGMEPSKELRYNMDVNGGKGMTPAQFLETWKQKYTAKAEMAAKSPKAAIATAAPVPGAPVAKATAGTPAPASASPAAVAPVATTTAATTAVVSASAPGTPSAPVQPAVANKAVSQASPAAAPTAAATAAPSMQKVSLDKSVADAAANEKLAAAQMHQQQQYISDNTQKSMAGVVDLLAKQLTVQISMDTSLRKIAEKLDMTKTKSTDSGDEEKQQRSASSQQPPDYRAAANTQVPPVNMSRNI